MKIKDKIKVGPSQKNALRHLERQMMIGLTEQLKISNKVLNLIDFIEIKNIGSKNIKFFSELKKPLLFHIQEFPHKGKAFIADDDLVQLLNNAPIKKIINSSKFSWISFHLGLPVKSFILDDNLDFIGTGPSIPKIEFFNKISRNLQKIKKLFPHLKILLETLPLAPRNISKEAYLYICDPNFINKVLDKNNCYFLFDIGHATVSAYNLGYKNPKDYFNKLPLDKTLEIHIHRPKQRKEKGLWRDAHLPIGGKEIESLRFVLERAQNAKAIVLEAQGLHPEKTLISELQILKQELGL